MQINNYDKRTNFQAKKILSAKTVKDGCENVLNVYKLNNSDTPFIERCLEVCYGKDKFIPEYSQNIHSNSSPLDAFKDFLKSFLNKKDGNYYIAIKDDSSFAGVLHTVDSRWNYGRRFTLKKQIRTDKKLVLDNDEITNTVLDDTVVKEMKKEIKSIKRSYEIMPNDFFTERFVLESDIAGHNVRYTANYTITKPFKHNMTYYTGGKTEYTYLKRKTPDTNYVSTYEDTNNYDLANVLEV